MDTQNRLKTNRTTRHMVTATVLMAFITALVTFIPASAYAGASLTVESITGGQGMTWAIGSLGGSVERTTGVSPSTHDGWSVTGATDGIWEDIMISVASSPATWDPSLTGTSADSEFGLIATSASNKIITGTTSTLVTLAKDGTHDLKLKFIAPNADTSDQSLHTLTVYLTADNWVEAALVVYSTLSATTGGFGGRSGGDSFCATHKPAALSGCTNTHAVVCVSATDEVRDFPANDYVTDTTIPVYSYQCTGFNRYSDNWADALDGDNPTIDLRYSGTPPNCVDHAQFAPYRTMWVGCDGAGAQCSPITNCTEWTTSASNIYGEHQWGNWCNCYTTSRCSGGRYLMCITHCATP